MNDYSQRKAGRQQLFSHLGFPIVILLLLQLMGGMMLSPHRSFFPIYVKELGYSAIWISTLAMARQLMSMIASLIGGTLSDSWGRKWTLCLGQIGFLLAGLVFFTSLPWLIAVLWALSGFGMGIHTLGGQSYLIDTAHPDYLGVLSAFYNWGYTMGGALGSPAAGFLLDNWDYPVFGVALTLFALTTIAINAFILPPSPVKRGRQTASLTKLFGYGEIATRPPVVILVILRFLPTLYWGMAVVLIPLMLDAAGASKTMIALYATVSQVLASLAQVIAGRAADRFGYKWPTAITFVALVGGIWGTGILPDRLWSIFFFSTLSAAAAWSLSTLLPTLVAQVTEPQARGRVLGWLHLWWSLAMIGGAWLGGALFDRWAGLPFLISGALNVLAIVLLFVFARMAADAFVLGTR